MKKIIKKYYGLAIAILITVIVNTYILFALIDAYNNKTEIYTTKPSFGMF